MENHMSSGNKIHTANIQAGATSFLAFICGAVLGITANPFDQSSMLLATM